MRRHDDVVHVEQRIERVHGFLLEDVEGRTGDVAVPQRIPERRLVNNAAAGDIDDPFEQGDLVFAQCREEITRLIPRVIDRLFGRD